MFVISVFVWIYIIYTILKAQIIEVSAEFGPNSALATRHYHISDPPRHNITTYITTIFISKKTNKVTVLNNK